MNCWEAAQRIAYLLKINKQMEIIKILESFSLEHRRFILSIKYESSSFLFKAVKYRYAFLVSFFLSCEADPNSYGFVDGEKITCLTAATMLNSKVIVCLLLIGGAKLETGIFSEPPLYCACKNGNYEIAKILIKHGADVNSHDFDGETCLMELKGNFELFQDLISAGANVNMANHLGNTPLLLSFGARSDKCIFFLLNYEYTDVRWENDFGEDALHLAVRCSSENIINRIIEKGDYTSEEVIIAYESQSCLCFIKNKKRKSKKLWRKALQLRHKPLNTPIFQNPRPLGKLDKVRDFFNVHDIPALLYLDSLSGLNNIFMLNVFTEAAYHVKVVENYIILCKLFFEIVYSLDDKYFFMTMKDAQQLIWTSFLDNHQKSSALKSLEILVGYMEEIYKRIKRMTPKERLHYGLKVELFLHTVGNILNQIIKNFSTDLYLFYKGIERIVKLDIRGLTQKSLFQLYAEIYKDHLNNFLQWRVNVNSTDKQGKTVLNTLIESKNAPKKVFKDIIEYGFDFNLVKYDEYCLPCRMKREGVLPNPVKHRSLQCLAANTFCQTTMNCFSDLPYHLIKIINSHLCF